MIALNKDLKMPKLEIKSDINPQLFAYTEALTTEKLKKAVKVCKAPWHEPPYSRTPRLPGNRHPDNGNAWRLAVQVDKAVLSTAKVSALAHAPTVGLLCGAQGL